MAACLLLCGCSYVKNRVNDLLDPFRVDVGVGPGLYAEARATDFAAVGLGARLVRTARWSGRFVSSRGWTESLALGPFILGNSTATGVQPVLPDDPSKYESGDGPVPGQILFLPLGGIGSCADIYRFHERGVRILDVGADVALGYVGAGVGFSPGEFVDLLLGFVGIDIAGDDAFGRPEPPAEEPAVPKPEAK